MVWLLFRCVTLLLQVFPADCREAGTSYTAPLHCTVCSQCVLFCVVVPRFLDAGANRYDDFPPVRVPKTITQIPIMVKSKRCNTCVRPALPILQYAVLYSVPPADTASRPPPTLPLVPSPSLSFSNILSVLVQICNILLQERTAVSLAVILSCMGWRRCV